MSYASLVQQVECSVVGKGLSLTLHAATSVGDTDLATWCQLELMGCTDDNPAATGPTEVPAYRTVGGTWFNEYGQPLVIEDPELGFVNEIRLVGGVLELESFVGASGRIAQALPDVSRAIKEHFGVDVSVFRYSPHSVERVLAGIKAHLISKLSEHHEHLSKLQEDMEIPKDEILLLKSSLYGVGIDLKALWRRIVSLVRG